MSITSNLTLSIPTPLRHCTELFPLPLHLSFSHHSTTPLRQCSTSISRTLRFRAQANRDGAVSASTSSSVTVDNDLSPDATAFSIRARNRIGLLQVITQIFKVLGLRVEKATIEFEGDFFVNRFFVVDSHGVKIEDGVSLEQIKKALLEAIDGNDEGDTVAGVGRGRGAGGLVVRRPGFLSGPKEGRTKAARMFRLMDEFLRNDPVSLQKDILHHVEYTVARSRFSFDDYEAYQALSHSVRDRLLERWHDTQQYFKRKDPKRIYFLSLEFLMGRALSNSIINLGLRDEYGDALNQLGFEFEVLAELEGDAALGNGGLARLSACLMESLATLEFPAWGYGLRYQYGLFRQNIIDGFQHERPDYWLNFGNPWEIERVHISYPVKLYGKVEDRLFSGRKCKVWIPGETVEAVAYDNLIPGYGTRNTINLRLWAAKPSDRHDIESYTTGDYINAVINRQHAETISSVLFPDDHTYQGKELRLKQQYFFVSASVQDIIRRYKDSHSGFDEFPEKGRVRIGLELFNYSLDDLEIIPLVLRPSYLLEVALQLNDIYPSLAIPEVMRVLIDKEHLSWEQAWDASCKIFSFSTHTVDPEEFEKVPVDLMENLLPRHLQIIYDINQLLIEELKKRFGLDYSRISVMSIVEEGAIKSIRMVNLALSCCHRVDGVSRVHFNVLKTKVLKDFYELWPQKFQYVTNGVTQRRWLVVSNPGLCGLISKWLGTDAWICDAELLMELRDHADDANLQTEWRKVRRVNKIRLAEFIESSTGMKVSPDAMFDVQMKRIHEYKRQLLNLLGIIHRYCCIKSMKKGDRRKVVPRVCILGGKAAPGYEIAKKIIKLSHAVGERINNDPDVGDLLKLVYIPDYNVSVAELVIPGSDLSQHISTAGHEASGTGNMKFQMNGCLLLATADGSTVEIIEEIGEENMFIFGAKADEVTSFRENRQTFKVPLQFSRVVRMVRDGYFGFEEYFRPLCDSIEGDRDFYLLGHDFTSYLEAQAAADKAFVDLEKWAKMSILTTAGSGRFSSDRTILEYAKKTWGVSPCKCPIQLPMGSRL